MQRGNGHCYMESSHRGYIAGRALGCGPGGTLPSTRGDIQAVTVRRPGWLSEAELPVSDVSRSQTD